MYPILNLRKDFLCTDSSMPNTISSDMKVKRLTNVSRILGEGDIPCHFHAVHNTF